MTNADIAPKRRAWWLIGIYKVIATAVAALGVIIVYAAIGAAGEAFGLWELRTAPDRPIMNFVIWAYLVPAVVAIWAPNITLANRPKIFVIGFATGFITLIIGKLFTRFVLDSPSFVSYIGVFPLQSVVDLFTFFKPLLPFIASSSAALTLCRSARTSDDALLRQTTSRH